MMSELVTLELTDLNGRKFMFQPQTGWEIYDHDERNATWVNHKEGRNLPAKETYEQIKAMLLPISVKEQ